ncbi:MAG: o-succinylbenzoate synthase [Chlorobium sp.]|uniref:o-succinylbenzoate synthase n=1 Tax=Chlorobium sp. TaxID=1095 RepID=UPI0025C0445C|nr:o-succinylbenzoate synthase [Chlorobium sp.]MCF8382992.1 o-succinylbenzoate synthase [Chlorobium sp.]
MNAAYSHLYRYSIPFSEPITVKGCRLHHREGIVLALKSGDGKSTAYGEIAPLPGLHNEPLPAAEQQLMAVLTKNDFTESGPLSGELYPSVRTGLEMALFNLEAQSSQQLPHLSERAPAPAIALNALLFGDTATVEKRAEEYYRQGYRTFKLKVNAAGAEEALRSIRMLKSTYNGSIALRLDANQSMSLDEAVEFSRNVPEGSIEYIEEPLKNPEQIEELHERTSIPSALDETLWQNPELARSIPSKCLKAYVLKPNRLGGIKATLALAEQARNKSLQTVFSSTFESGISLSFYALMAACCAALPSACGLDTFRFLKHDLLDKPFAPVNARLDTQNLYWNGQKVALRSIKLTSIWTL